MDYATARHNMVEGQIRINQVNDALIVAAIGTVPREAFVPHSVAGIAYVDEAVEVAPGRYLLEPLVLARLLQAAEIQETDVVLEIGCATGYTAAVLSGIASTVVALESNQDLVAVATKTLSELQCDNVAVVEGGLEKGYPKQAPYDVIVFGGAVAAVPGAILAQLGDGGRLLAVVQGKPGSIGKGVLFARSGGQVSRRELFDLGAPFLPGFEPCPEFIF